MYFALARNKEGVDGGMTMATFEGLIVLLVMMMITFCLGYIFGKG